MHPPLPPSQPTHLSLLERAIHALAKPVRRLADTPIEQTPTPTPVPLVIHLHQHVYHAPVYQHYNQ
jgi:hypothetical protein